MSVPNVLPTASHAKVALLVGVDAQRKLDGSGNGTRSDKASSSLPPHYS